MAILGISRISDFLTRRTVVTLVLSVSPMPPSSRSLPGFAESPGSLVSVSSGWFWYTSDGSGHLADLGFSDAAVPLARPLADTYFQSFGLSWASDFLAPSIPPDILSLLAPLGSLLPETRSLSLSILVTFLILGLRMSRMARQLLFQRPFDAS